MGWYSIALFIHIVGVLGVFMALAIELASMLGSHHTQRAEVVNAWYSTGKLLAIIFPITSLLILGAGLFMTIRVWGWDWSWINISLIVLILMSMAGSTVNARHSKHIKELSECIGNGPITAELASQLNHPIHWTSVITMTTAALGVVFLMTTKPDLVGSLVTLTFSIILGVLLAQMLLHSNQIRVPASDPEEQESQLIRK